MTAVCGDSAQAYVSHLECQNVKMSAERGISCNKQTNKQTRMFRLNVRMSAEASTAEMNYSNISNVLWIFKCIQFTCV